MLLFWCQPIKTATWNPVSMDLLKCWKWWVNNFLVCGTGIWTQHYMLTVQIFFFFFEGLLKIILLVYNSCTEDTLRYLHMFFNIA
jgi:hypothetical protein